MTKLGRPRVKAQRAKQVAIRLNGDEHRALRVAADISTISVSTYARSILVGAMKQKGLLK